MFIFEVAMKSHWYYVTRYVCVLCGREVVYRERRYTKRPKRYWKRNSYHETACDSHFI